MNRDELRIYNAGRRRQTALEAVAGATVDLRALVLGSDLPETRLAELAGVDRMTIRKWKGKR